jgi:outer membrane protein OmpA-like peptidoglycan-associated protein
MQFLPLFCWKFSFFLSTFAENFEIINCFNIKNCMKKFLMVLAFAGVSVAGMAQSETPELKYSVATNSFWSNWFIQGNVTWNAWYGVGEKSLVAPFHKFPTGEDWTGLGASVAVGKWFTPGLGLRTKVNAWQIGSKVNGVDADKYWTANEQVLFNLSNLLCGYSETRVWNLIPYIGAGVFRNMSLNEYSSDLSCGILNEFRLSRKVAINAELGWNSYEGIGMGLKERPQQFTLELGLTYNLGKGTWNKTPDVDAIKALSQSQIDALNAQLADANAENARLNNLIKNHKCPEAKTITVKEVAVAPVSVFFNLGSAKIASRKDLQNVKDLVNVANDKKIVVTGYADSKTGSASLNQRLSEKRANAVADELVKMGVSRDNIEIVAAGGVNTLTPIAYNRRATVEVK